MISQGGEHGAVNGQYNTDSENGASGFGGMEWWNGIVEWNGLVEYWNRGFALHAGEKCTENEIWSS